LDRVRGRNLLYGDRCLRKCNTLSFFAEQPAAGEFEKKTFGRNLEKFSGIRFQPEIQSPNSDRQVRKLQFIERVPWRLQQPIIFLLRSFS
jgi:hypothetical protein